MRGPEHYVQAEMLLNSVGVRDVDDSYTAEFDARTAQVIAAAQVHATLALAAAAGLQIRGADAAGWEAVAGPHLAMDAP